MVHENHLMILKWYFFQLNVAQLTLVMTLQLCERMLLTNNGYCITGQVGIENDSFFYILLLYYAHMYHYNKLVYIPECKQSSQTIHIQKVYTTAQSQLKTC